MGDWESFFIAQVGASAALAGLIFVSVSINLARILQIPTLPNRAIQALVFLLQILVVSSLTIVPGQSLAALGSELLAIGLVVWLTTTLFDRRNLQATEPQYRRVALFNLGMSQLAALPYVAGGAALLSGTWAGLYLLVPGILLSYAKAMLDAWVLLVEINR